MADAYALITQVNQADLKYVHPAAREAAGGARAALGNDYEMQLRSEAGPMPGKLAKRKHQISSLYHHAKIRVSLRSAMTRMACRLHAGCISTPVAAPSI